MSIVRHIARASDPGRDRPQLRLVAPQLGSVREELELSESLRGRWNELPPAARSVVQGMPFRREDDNRDAASSVTVIVDDPRLPRELANDILRGAPRLHAAFPGLVRRLAAIEGGREISIDVICEGRHAAPLYGILAPTQRIARFRERYAFALAGARLTELRISIDVRSIVSQLCARP